MEDIGSSLVGESVNFMKTIQKTGLLKSGIGNVFLKHVISYETEMLRFAIGE